MVCASSDGGPGLKLGEQIAGRSILGTTIGSASRRSIESDDDGLMYPSSGLEADGSAISALMPHTTVVSPTLTNAEPSAVEIDPSRVVSASSAEELMERFYQY